MNLDVLQTTMSSPRSLLSTLDPQSLNFCRPSSADKHPAPALWLGRRMLEFTTFGHQLHLTSVPTFGGHSGKGERGTIRQQQQGPVEHTPQLSRPKRGGNWTPAARPRPTRSAPPAGLLLPGALRKGLLRLSRRRDPHSWPNTSRSSMRTRSLESTPEWIPIVGEGLAPLTLLRSGQVLRVRSPRPSPYLRRFQA
jgi:hypothetical protein